MARWPASKEKAEYKSKKESIKTDSILSDVQSDEKTVDDSGQKSQDNEINKNDDLQSHPKFAKFKQGEKQP